MLMQMFFFLGGGGGGVNNVYYGIVKIANAIKCENFALFCGIESENQKKPCKYLFCGLLSGLPSREKQETTGTMPKAPNQ